MSPTTKLNPIDPEELAKLRTPAPQVEPSQPLTIVTELDAYISERMKGQPTTVADIAVVTRQEKAGRHRLSLPDYFERQSYDCTHGVGCESHRWSSRVIDLGEGKHIQRWEMKQTGGYVFRWLRKDKRALDQACTVTGWFLVNRRYFPDAPTMLFATHGGVDLGDSVLAFMTAQHAVAIREAPGRKSRERVDSTLRKYEGDPRFYAAKPDGDEDGSDSAPAGALQEGRDF